MNDTHFLQYYNQYPWITSPRGLMPKWSFSNGFSTAYKQLKNIGDFIWLKSGDEIPINSGNLYVSLQYKEDGLDKLIQKAIENPDMNITIGGPHFHTDLNRDFPSNITPVYDKSVEEHFNIKYSPDNWDLELPDGFDDIGYNFSLTHTNMDCYWGKCKYCKWSLKLYKELPVLKIPIIEYPSHKYIGLKSAAVPPNQMRKLLVDLPQRDDVSYNFYMRANETSLEMLQDTLPKMKTHNLLISIGVEFPSNMMLNYMNKGTTKEIIFEVIKLLSNYEDVRMHLSFMLGWGNLKWDYVYEAEEWLDNLNETVNLNKITMVLYRLFILKGTRIFYNTPTTSVKETKYGSYFCILNDEQQQMDNYLRTLYYKYFSSRILDYYNDNRHPHEFTRNKESWTTENQMS